MILMCHILSIGITKEMEQYKNIKTLMTQLLVSFSIFSLVFSWSSLFSSPLMYYDKLFYFSRNYLQLFSIAMNKNCVFLICNGILVVVAKTSAFVRSPSCFDLNDMLQKSIADSLQIDTESQPVLEKHLTLGEEDEDEEDEETESRKEGEEMKASTEEAEEFECSNERAEEVSISIADSDDEGGISSVHEDVENDESEQKHFWLFDDDDYDDDDDDDDDDEEQVYPEEEDEMEKLSTEELNQKFEDFIRRTKEEFRINEARQQQLVMVN